MYDSTFTSARAKAAKENFLNGHNCAQAVCLAFADMLTIERDILLMVSSSFGGGMSRLREVCGTVSGMFIVFGLLKGYTENETHEQKAAHYRHIQELAKRFKEENGSYICRELLGLSQRTDTSVPEKRTEDYYKKRPCAKLCESAAAILEEYLKEISE